MTGQVLQKFTIENWHAGLDWAADGKGLFVSTSTPRGSAVTHVDLRGNARVIWEQEGGVTNYAVPSTSVPRTYARSTPAESKSPTRGGRTRSPIASPTATIAFKGSIASHAATHPGDRSADGAKRNAQLGGALRLTPADRE